ncbi:MAG: P-loop NTPase [Myxococcota bacterium]|nr:P-loop NTPase [Myxococcota bacterium]
MVDLVRQQTAGRRQGARYAIVVGGGRGGVGRTMIAANLALYLGRQGRRVTVVDLDVSGSAIHTRLGLPMTVPTPAARIRSSSVRQDRLAGTQLHICGPDRQLSGESDETVMRAVIAAAHASPSDILIFDIGRGSTELAMDTYLDADLALSVAVPEPAAIEQVYAFLRTALTRRLVDAPTPSAQLVRQILNSPKGEAMPTFRALFEYIERTCPEAWESVREARTDFTPCLIMNRCKHRSERDMLRGMVTGLSLRWGIDAMPLGTLEEDDVAREAARWRRPLLTTYPSSLIATGIERIGGQVLSMIDQREGR